MKQCKSCGLVKEDHLFYTNRTKCKNCYNSVRRERYNTDEDFRKKRANQIQQRKYRLRKEDPEYYLRHTITSLLRLSLRKRHISKKLFREYGIDVSSILSVIGKKPGGDYHLDHILPQSVFDYSDPFHIWACNHERNLRWLDGGENCSKSDSFDEQELHKYLSEMRVLWDGRER